MLQLIMMLERQCNIWKLCDYESMGPDTVVDQKHCAPHIVIDFRNRVDLIGYVPVGKSADLT